MVDRYFLKWYNYSIMCSFIILCLCGCGRKIDIEAYHKRYPNYALSSFLPGHWAKVYKPSGKVQSKQTFSQIHKKKLERFKILEQKRQEGRERLSNRVFSCKICGRRLTKEQIWHRAKTCSFRCRNLYFQKTGVTGRSKYKLDKTFFDKWTAESAYIFGLLMSDGCITDRGQIIFSSKDKELTLLVKTLTSAEHPIRKKENTGNFTGKPQKQFILIMQNQHWKNILPKLGFKPRKTGKEVFPKMNRKLKSHFIRGYFDGDGSVSISKGRLLADFTCLNLNFLKETKKCLQKNGINSNINKRKQKGKWRIAHSLQIRAKDSLEKFYYFLYKNASMNYLKRKFVIFENFQKEDGFSYKNKEYPVCNFKGRRWKPKI